MTAVLKQDRPDVEDVRGQVRRRKVHVYPGPEGWRVKPAGCGRIRRKARHYKDTSTQIDEVETEEEAAEYLEDIRRRSEEGKTTRLP